MKRLKRLILLFCLAISIPLAYVILHSYQSLHQEERAQLRFFSQALFDEIEKEMADLVRREENRAVDEYHHTLAQDTGSPRPSPIAQTPVETYVLGYLQNNPDGSFQTPLAADLERAPREQAAALSLLRETNTVFNQKKLAATPKPAPPAPKMVDKIEPARPEKDKAAFSDRYLSKSQPLELKGYLGQKPARREEITAGQALNLSREDRTILRPNLSLQEQAAPPAAGLDARTRNGQAQVSAPLSVPDSDKEMTAATAPTPAIAASAFQVEVAPLQSLHIRDSRFFIFRRIAINNQIFRQGFVLEADRFLRHLAATHFEPQPMAAFTGLNLQLAEDGHWRETLHSGQRGSADGFITQRTFPAPFDFIAAAVQAASIPPSPARRTLNATLAVLGLFMLLGLLAIYHSARAVVDLSERRSQFVSSVTHELKTPLTNIRMYVEMLEQGIAANPKREQEYLQILGAESARLSRLINNVLELAKLEKKQRRFDLREGRLDEVLAEVRTIMDHKLRQEGFALAVETGDLPPFPFDREVLVQMMVNLMENSIKFGRATPDKRITISAQRQEGWVRLAVADSGPGIPRQALDKVFDDFYRVDNDLTRATGGTGLGLALVKKFAAAMGGRVQAANNAGPGCTITLFLPLITKKTAA